MVTSPWPADSTPVVLFQMLLIFLLLETSLRCVKFVVFQDPNVIFLKGDFQPFVLQYVLLQGLNCPSEGQHNHGA